MKIILINGKYSIKGYVVFEKIINDKLLPKQQKFVVNLWVEWKDKLEID